MKYLIDNKIEFNSDDGSLFYPASKDIIKLTLPASRLLEEFLLSDGRDLTRDYLLETVWDRHGLQASGNNLNQYVSILRRNLAMLDCHELIVTLPKVGFRLNTRISVMPVAETTQQETAPVPRTPLPLSQPLVPETPVVTAAPKKKTLPAILGALTVLCAAALGLWEYQDDHDEKTVVTHKESGCEVIFLKDISERRQKDAMQEVANIMKKNGLQCLKDNVIIYNREVTVSNLDTRRTLLSLCVLGKNREIISCDNFYHYKWIKP
ncbi:MULTISPECIES: winged helix-turn-helix domain-containing protein [Rahnella]|uniref:Winged helix-turn-helix domain-containing protein n=1 Tax=Rahnella laticis TaxID=2787622 RepID=A0ABS0E1Q1_9GAMM|nr:MULTISPECIES: winged helix-turn-helix domain-containing protein [Rahnella]MBF7979018.1 winged helix-turn-helix domain-containing protein [Rahnella laticis]MBF7999108.1 winged helix-turn-helix domain-containing protein [Rahnella sp. LAC-M12]